MPGCAMLKANENTMAGQERDCGRKENAAFSTYNGTFFLLFEEEALHFYFPGGAPDYTAGPV